MILNDFKFARRFPSMSMLHHIEKTLKYIFYILQIKFILNQYDTNMTRKITWLYIVNTSVIAITNDFFTMKARTINSLILIPIDNTFN